MPREEISLDQTKLSPSDEVRPQQIGAGEAEELLSQAEALEAAREVAEAGKIVDRLLSQGHRTPALAILQARMAVDLKRERQALELIAQMLGRDEPSRLPRTTSSLHLAAANLLDRLGNYDEAFRHASQANGPRAGNYDARSLERLANSCIACFTRNVMRHIPRASNRDSAPIFIVGMPRSGSTLVEQILASHPEVFGAGELQWVSPLWKTLLGQLGLVDTSLADGLAAMSVKVAEEVAATYLGPLHELRPDATRIIDKTLSNFMHLGLIAILFPRARVIHCRRDPLDTCLSCYMTNFDDDLPFTWSLQALGHFHRLADQTMAHWKGVLDVPILEVDYERVANDLEGQTRRLLQFADLTWDTRCLQFHENRRRVMTASYAQVRRPIYRSSIGRWRNYQKWLAPLRASLER